MTSINHKIEVLSGPERRRRWSTAEKLAIVQETYEADATVSIIARRHGIQPNQLFAWRRLASQGALTATTAEEEVVPASEYRALQAQVKELQRLLGQEDDESEIIKEAPEIAGGQKNGCCARSLFRRKFWNEDRLRNSRCRPVEYRCAGHRLPLQSQRTPTTPGSGTGEGYQGRHRRHAHLRLSACPCHPMRRAGVSETDCETICSAFIYEGLFHER
ncbi:transposase (plasmid) [Sinorhizobium americanum CCGM7]|nr:transposase [Sinorhizobium americanum CCGM7]